VSSIRKQLAMMIYLTHSVIPKFLASVSFLLPAAIRANCGILILLLDCYFVVVVFPYEPCKVGIFHFGVTVNANPSHGHISNNYNAAIVYVTLFIGLHGSFTITATA
jgi:hypothetical protein